ncbi:inactive peptidyl-prolyl cis-trans isomerase shutdown [Calliopsis andreniformis]|uniref:inactive peptidyl-prolyl cis-trans isomerase shutdown n=1 Tax=Calliopsis andreniformis TaxID=337506 RepID=UPI003FCE0254
MTKHINAMNGFSLSDLTRDDGLIFEIGDEYKDDEEEFSYSPNVQLTNEEALNLLNMDNFQDDDEDDDNEGNNSVSICDINFEKLKSKMTSITENNKVMKVVKQEGVGQVIPNDAQVTVRYMGHIQDHDEPFDSSFTRGGTDTLRLAQSAILPGLEIAIASMRKHEISIFIVHPDLAYGKHGCPPRIPPNQEILFIVHLIDYVDNGSVRIFEHLTIEEKRHFCNVVKGVQAKFNTAKDYFQKKKIKQAIREYSKAIQWLEEAELKNQEDEDEYNKLLSRGYNNLAVCYNIENMPRRTCIACNRVPTPTAKTHFNHGRALIRIGEYDSAMEKLQLALKMEPNNEETVKEIRLANEKQRKYLETQKQLWKHCLNTKQKEKVESSFEKTVREMCETFVRDCQLLRQPLPESLTPEEDKCIREHAAAFGLTVTTHQRYGREITYLNKPNY